MSIDWRDDVFDSFEYDWIRTFYGERVAERSQVPLINHINEGIDILYEHNADEMAARAFALHPLFQSDVDLTKHVKMTYAMGLCDPRALIFVMEYRRAANAYLCTPRTDLWSIEEAKKSIGLLLPQVRHMLIADKVQNRKDFMIYHYGTHARSEQLLKYFNNWHEILEIDLPDDIKPVE